MTSAAPAHAATLHFSTIILLIIPHWTSKYHNMSLWDTLQATIRTCAYPSLLQLKQIIFKCMQITALQFTQLPSLPLCIQIWMHVHSHWEHACSIHGVQFCVKRKKIWTHLFVKYLLTVTIISVNIYKHLVVLSHIFPFNSTTFLVNTNIYAISTWLTSHTPPSHVLGPFPERSWNHCDVY